MSQRAPFPPVFWVANLVEVLERFAYYGIYYSFGIYLVHLGYSRDQLGFVQTLFLLLSYGIPVISGTFADRFGFKKVLIVAYLAYLPAISLLILTKSFSGIALTMLTIGLAAGIFKPLVAGTVRAVTDKTNTSLGFGIFYAMVNIGGTFGPIVMGNLRQIDWNYMFYAAAGAIVVMLLITVFFYKEPPRQTEGACLGDKLREIGTVLKDLKFATFLFLLGFFFWIPFWAFSNICSLYVDANLDTAALYQSMRGVIGTSVADYFSGVKEDGVRRVLGETISNTGYIIMLSQVGVSFLFKRFRPMPSFLFGLFVAALGFVVIGFAKVSGAWLIFPGIALFALGEMIASPRIQEYITWLAPKEKAGLYMGTNFLAVSIGAFSGVIYTSLFGWFDKDQHPQYVWYVLAAHMAMGVPVFMLFRRLAGDFKTHIE